jgi:hypothetical protein
LPLACEGFVRMLRAEVARPQGRQRASIDA